MAKRNHLQELAINNARRKLSSPEEDSTEEKEKETSFTKSPADNKQIGDFYELADIQFADDEDEDEEDDEETIARQSAKETPRKSKKDTKPTKVWNVQYLTYPCRDSGIVVTVEDIQTENGTSF